MATRQTHEVDDFTGWVDDGHETCFSTLQVSESVHTPSILLRYTFTAVLVVLSSGPTGSKAKTAQRMGTCI